MVTICYHTTYKNGDDWWQRDRITITCIGAQDDLWNSMRVGFPELLSAQKRISSKAPVFAWKETVFSCKFTLTLTQWRLDDQNNLYRSPAFVNFAHPFLRLQPLTFGRRVTQGSCGILCCILDLKLWDHTYPLNIGWHSWILIVDGEPTMNYGSWSLLFMVKQQAIIMDLLSLQKLSGWAPNQTSRSSSTRMHTCSQAIREKNLVLERTSNLRTLPKLPVFWSTFSLVFPGSAWPWHSRTAVLSSP